MLLIDGYTVVLAVLIVLTVGILVWLLFKARRMDRRFTEISRHLQLLSEKIEHSTIGTSSSSSRADTILQRQHEQLVQHLVSLVGGVSGSDTERHQESVAKREVNPAALEEAAQVVARKIIEELNKKW